MVIRDSVGPYTTKNVREPVTPPPKVGGGLVATATPLADSRGLALKVPEGGPRPHSVGHGPAYQDPVLGRGSLNDPARQSNINAMGRRVALFPAGNVGTARL
eukprot:15459674-Alexandrium_andersonii.AAC.1